MLKEVHPGSTWVGFCRSWLEQKIEIREQILALSQRQRIKQSSQIFDVRLVSNFLKPIVPALAVLLLFMAGSAGLVLAANDALPGNFLFPVKVAFERTRLVLTPDKEKSRLQIEITNNRLQELRQIVIKNPQADSNNAIRALKELNQELVVMKKQLPKMAKEQKLKEAVQIAKTAAEITNKIPISASIINSTCGSFASSSCAFSNQEENQELPTIQTMKMAQEIIKNIEELSKEESSQEKTPLESSPGDLR